MGFRNPITTAAAVDTGQPGGARARVYQGSDTTGTYGVLEFDDGIAGDTPAQVIGRANLTPQPGGGGYTAQGGGLTVKGGSYNGVTAPELDLNVEQAPAGGYQPVARLKAGAGGQIITDNPMTLPAGSGVAMPAGGYGYGSLPANTSPIVKGGTYVGATDAGGNISVPFSPGAFPGGCLLVMAVPGDTAGNLSQLIVYGTNSKTSFSALCRNGSGGACANSTVRINWQAIGW